MKEKLDYAFENEIEVIVTYSDAGETVKAVGLITYKSDYSDSYDLLDASNVLHGFDVEDVIELIY